MEEPDVPSWLELGVASRPFPGEALSGDCHLVQAHPRGALVGVVDGAGHGLEARDAAMEAVSLFKGCPGDPLDSLLARCHDVLRSTRGAAVTLASIDRSALSMTWAGVGNVEGLFLRRHQESGYRRESLLLRNGVVGYEYSSPRVATLPAAAGDLLILVTDGISSYFLEKIDLENSSQAIADGILARYGKHSDDALALVARIVQTPS